MSTTERLWLTWCCTVVLLALLTPGGGEAGHRPVAFVSVQIGVAALQCVPRLLAARSAAGTRAVRAALALVGLPTVFSSLAWLLPAVHPEPYECAWLRADQLLFGGDSTAVLRAATPSWWAAALQCCYAAFYAVPVTAALLVWRRRGGAAFDRALAILVGGFLCSYLGYLLWPTLAPRVVLPVEDADLPEFARSLASLIDAGEANPWDCFPSGHTMLSVTSVLLVWRWARRWTAALLAVVVPLIASTMVLRYHWPVDVAVGALLAWPAMRACDALLARDGAPPA